MIHADELQDALNRRPSTRYTAWQESLPPSIRREVYSQSEQQKCDLDQRHPMCGLTAAPSRLRSKKSFLRAVSPLDKHTTHQLKTHNLSKNYTDNILDQYKLQNFPVQESLPPLPGYKLQWNKWRCLNRLRSGAGKTKSLPPKWGYLLPALIPPANVEKKIKP